MLCYIKYDGCIYGGCQAQELRLQQQERQKREGNEREDCLGETAQSSCCRWSVKSLWEFISRKLELNM